MTNFQDTDGTDGESVEMPRLRMDDQGRLMYPEDWQLEDAVWAVYVLQNRADYLREHQDD